jgi:lipid A disaccharide synthetase
MQGRDPKRKIFLIATEESGDRLGSALMKVLRQRLGDGVQFEGVGGRTMAREGLETLFPIEELSIVGFAAVVQQLPKILRLIRETADAVLEAAPDALVIIDSPDFTHRVARRVRARNPAIPIVDYVSPQLWAWRPGRARTMLGYVDHVLGLLPFEPEEYRKLGGPPCSYVGHPLIEQLGSLRPNAEEQKRRDAEPPVLLVLPGSRRSEIRHHIEVFGAALGRRVRADAADHAASRSHRPRSHRKLAGQAADRDRRGREAHRLPDRARCAGEIRHGHAGAGAVGHSDGDGLSRRRHRGLHPAPRDPRLLGDPCQSRDR